MIKRMAWGLIALALFAGPVVAQQDTALIHLVERGRADAVSTRGFNRSVETVLTRVILRYDSILAVLRAATPAPPPIGVPVPPPVVPPAPPVAGLYPNLPAGAVILGRNDGSVRDADGRAFGIAGLSRWYTDATRNPDAITVVNDPSNPSGSGKAIRFKWVPGAQWLSGVADGLGFAGAPYRTLYVGMLQFYEAGWSNGHKNFYFGPPGNHSAYWIEWQNPGTTRVIPQGRTPVLEIAAASRTVGSWHMVEMLVTADPVGSVTVWIDGTLAGRNASVSWGTTGFGTIHWYATSNSIPSVQYQRIGGLVVAGVK